MFYVHWIVSPWKVGRRRKDARWQTGKEKGEKTSVFDILGHVMTLQNVRCVFLSTIIRLCNSATDALRSETLRQDTLVSHMNTNTHYVHHETMAHEERLQKNCNYCAIQQKWKAVGRRQRGKRLCYSPGSKTFQTEHGCFTACTQRSTCHCIMEHMLLFSAASHRGCFTPGGTDNKAKQWCWHVKLSKYGAF